MITLSTRARKSIIHMTAFVLLLAASNSLIAQIVSYRDRNVVDYQDYLKYSKTISSDSEKVESYVGSPYMEEEFKDGVLYIEKDNKSNPIPMRYNMYADQVEFKRAGYTYIMEPVLSVNMVSIGSHLFILGEHVEGTKYSLGFYEAIDTGRVNLMMRQVVRLRPGEAPKALASAPTPPAYLKLGFQYYYQTGSREVIEIEKVKRLIESLPNHVEALKLFAKKEKISKNKEDLQKLIQYYNSL